MNKVPITTAQNIVVYANTAKVSNRILSTIIDLFLLYAILMILFQLESQVSFISYVVYFIVTFYHLAWEVLNDGQSPGKMILSIKVVTLQGCKPSFESLLIRWAFRLIDLAGSLGIVGVTSMITNKYSQRLGDHLADTIVVSLKNYNEVSLKNLEKLNTLKLDKFEFPLITQYDDKTMLMVKKLLTRCQIDYSPPNIELAREVANDIGNNVGLKEQRPPLEFLNQVLNEYVQLTR